LAIPCSADVITVDPNGTGDYTTIQAAIDAAYVGDTVIVVEGIYTENVSSVSEITIHFTQTATINGQVTTGTGTDIISDGDLTINSDSDITLGGPVTISGKLGLYADVGIVINNTVQALEIEMIADVGIDIGAAASVNGTVSVEIYAGSDITGSTDVITGGSVVIEITGGVIHVGVAGTIYVDKDAAGNNDGTSWDDAFNNLYDAMDASWPGNEIFVAEGTYYPDPNGLTDPREATFALKNGVTIKGGYAGYGTADPNDRNVELYETILSGDIGTVSDNSDNCYHVFYHPDGTNLDHTAILDGFTITAGNADESYPSPHGNGGGMWNFESSPTVSNCTFSGNSANGTYGLGGGMCNYYSSPTVTNCTFGGNSAYDSGGGMCNYIYSSPTVTGCTFSGNSVGYEHLTGYGGGMANYYHSNPIVTGCTFTGNSANFAGGMYNYDYSNTTVTGCTFTGNSAESVFLFDGNGGGMNNEGSSPIVTNCTFTGNLAESFGGGMYNEWDSSPAVTNCILWGNRASSGGNEIALTDSSTIDVAYCDVQGGQAGTYDDGSGNTVNWGSGNIDVDPLFIDPNGPDGIIGTEDDNLRLSAGSPCIDAGDPNFLADPNETDLDGNPRIINGIVDMGAYETLLPIEVDVHIVPRVINRRSHLKRIIAIMRLPEGLGRHDIADEPFELYAEDLGPDAIESTWQRVIGRGNGAMVFAIFSKDELMEIVSDSGPVELTVTGKLISGQYIYGSDTVRIVPPGRGRRRWRRW
jgi:hypothetical protein